MDETTTGPGEWLYALGVPRYQAHAFAAYYLDHCAGMEFPAAKRKFDNDPHGSEYLRRFGRRIVARP